MTLDITLELDLKPLQLSLIPLLFLLLLFLNHKNIHIVNYIHFRHLTCRKDGTSQVHPITHITIFVETSLKINVRL